MRNLTWILVVSVMALLSPAAEAGRWSRIDPRELSGVELASAPVIAVASFAEGKVRIRIALIAQEEAAATTVVEPEIGTNGLSDGPDPIGEKRDDSGDENDTKSGDGGDGDTSDSRQSDGAFKDFVNRF